MDGKTKKITKKILLYVLLIILALIWIVPIFTLVATALKHKKDFMSGLSLFQLPAEIAWDNFTNAITKGNLFTYMKNDLIISCLKVPLGIFVGAMASFALTRLNIKHRIGIFVFFLIGMMLPMQTALVPINIIYSKLNLLNTYFGLFYVYIGFGISYCILIMRGLCWEFRKILMRLHVSTDVISGSFFTRSSCRSQNRRSQHCLSQISFPHGMSIFWPALSSTTMP